jgi:hypothetical protein
MDSNSERTMSDENTVQPKKKRQRAAVTGKAKGKRAMTARGRNRV